MPVSLADAVIKKPHGLTECFVCCTSSHVSATPACKHLLGKEGMMLTLFPDFASLRVVGCPSIAPLDALVAEDCVGRGEVVGDSRCCLCWLLNIGRSHGGCVGR